MFLPGNTKKLLGIAVFLCFCATFVTAQEASVQQKGYYSSDFVIDGIPRNITFYIPAGFGKKDTYPLVFMLHAESETGKVVIKKYGNDLEKLADSAAAIMVFPDAVHGHWNTKIGNRAASDTVNDAGFANIMIDYFIQQYKADPNKIFAAGFNSGGQMALQLGCDIPKKIAAVAPFTAPVDDLQKACLQRLSVFNADKYMKQPARKLPYDALSDAFNFLLQHARPQQ